MTADLNAHVQHKYNCQEGADLSTKQPNHASHLLAFSTHDNVHNVNSLAPLTPLPPPLLPALSLPLSLPPAPLNLLALRPHNDAVSRIL